MDYKELTKSLLCNGYGAGEDADGCANKKCKYRDADGACDLTRMCGDAAIAINELLAENQALRNAANGFKKQLETAESRAEKAERERDAAVSDLLRAEEAAEETNALLDDEVHPACDYSLYLAVHDSVSDIVNWEYDDVWRSHKEEKE